MRRARTAWDRTTCNRSPTCRKCRCRFFKGVPGQPKPGEVNKYLVDNDKYFGGYEELKETRRKSKIDDCQEE